jgi:hypothetical protein
MSNETIFICYSRCDGEEFAGNLSVALARAGLNPWTDRTGIEPGEDWDSRIEAEIRGCSILVFVMTHDSVTANSVCKLEWSLALECGKPVVPLAIEPGVNPPFRLHNRQFIDCVCFEDGLARLLAHIRWLDTSEGTKKTKQAELTDMRRSLSRTQTEQNRLELRRRIATLASELDDVVEPFRVKQVTPARPVPPLLPWLIDRSHHEQEMCAAIERAQSRGAGTPVVCIISGDADQCHDKFVDRVCAHRLSGLFQLSERQGSFRRFYLAFPRHVCPARDFSKALATRLARELHLNAEASLEELTSALSQRHSLIYSQVVSCDWDGRSQSQIRSFLKFWDSLPHGHLSQPLIVTLCVKYSNRRTMFGRVSSWLSSNRIRTFLKSFEGRSYENSVVVALPELQGITQSDAEDWALTHARDHYASEDLLPQIRDLFSDCSELSMEAATSALRQLLH